MKKIVNHPKNFRLEGLVESDGIGFVPIWNMGPMSIQTSGYFAYTDDEGMLSSRVLDVNDFEENNSGRIGAKIKSYAGQVMMTAIIGIFVCIAMAFMRISWANQHIWLNALATATYLLLIATVIPKACAVALGRIFHNQEIINFSKYLGAKNAVENAYYDLGRVPNIEEVKDYSIHSVDCQYTKNGYMACLALIICCVRLLNGWWYWIATIFALVIMWTLEWKNHLTLWQWLVVSTPSEEHYKVAIRAMEETSEIIDCFHVVHHNVEVKFDPESFNAEKCKGCPAYTFCKEANDELRSQKR